MRKSIDITFKCELIAEGQYYLNGTRLHFDEPWAIYIVNNDLYMPYYRIYINGSFKGVALYEREAYAFLLAAKNSLSTTFCMRHPVQIPKIIRMDIVDNDTELSERLQDTFYLVEPDDDLLSRFEEMVEKRNERQDEGKESVFYGDYAAVIEWINEHFKVINIDTKEVHW